MVVMAQRFTSPATRTAVQHSTGAARRVRARRHAHARGARWRAHAGALPRTSRGVASSGTHSYATTAPATSACCAFDITLSCAHATSSPGAPAWVSCAPLSAAIAAAASWRVNMVTVPLRAWQDLNGDGGLAWASAMGMRSLSLREVLASQLLVRAGRHRATAVPSSSRERQGRMPLQTRPQPPGVAGAAEPGARRQLIAIGCPPHAVTPTCGCTASTAADAPPGEAAVVVGVQLQVAHAPVL